MSERGIKSYINTGKYIYCLILAIMETKGKKKSLVASCSRDTDVNGVYVFEIPGSKIKEYTKYDVYILLV